MNESPFLFLPELDKITRVCDRTRRRMEQRGHFPKRIRIGAWKIAYRKSEIEEWASDPEGWAKRHAPSATLGG
jgi:predicted DNA-binding transcriptional regulator AlpA